MTKIQLWKLKKQISCEIETFINWHLICNFGEHHDNLKRNKKF